MESRETLAARLAEAGVGRHAVQLATLAQPCIHLRSAAAEDEALPPGASRIGGAPDLPAGTAWPAWKGAPLAFLAQIDVGSLAGMTGAEVLPEGGLLSFFYDAEQSTWGFDPADRGSWAVLYTPPGVPLASLPVPDALPEEGRYSACTVTARPGLSLPAWDEAVVEEMAKSMTDDESDAYADFPPLADDGNDGGLHQVLGWPQPVQNANMALECQLASSGLYVGGPEGYADPRAAVLGAGASEWRLLLQLDSDDDAGMMWGDCGMLYFWIREADLRACIFDDVWMVLQCC